MDELDELFGQEIEYEQPTKTDYEDVKYRKLHMINWMANGGLCGCGKPIEFENFYQYGECLECFQVEAAGNI